VGQAIVYCATCQIRVRDADVEHERAFVVDGQTYCGDCAPRRPAKAVEPPPAPAAAPSRIASTRRVPLAGSAQPATSRGGALVAGIALALALPVGLLVLFGGKKPPAPPPAAPPPPVRSVRSAPSPAPPPLPEPPRPGAAPPAAPEPSELRRLLTEARSYAESRPEDVAGAIERFEKVVFRGERAPEGVEAAAALEKLRARFRSAVEPELKALDVEASARAAAGEWREARAVYEKARSRHALTEWAAALNKRVADLEASAAPAYAALRQRALKAREDGDEEEVKRAMDLVRRWGIRAYWEDLDRALNP